MDIATEHVKAVVLTGGGDFGRCEMASVLPAAVWDVAGEAAVVRTLKKLRDEGISRVLLCCGRQREQIEARVKKMEDMEWEFLEEAMPLGTGGCLRAGADAGDDVIVVLRAAMFCPAAIGGLVERHAKSGAAMTVVFERAGRANVGADIFICGRAVVEAAGKAGYSDIKEGLVPKLLRDGEEVRADFVEEAVLNFNDRDSYLRAMDRYLRRIGRDRGLRAPSAVVVEDVQILEPVLIGDEARIEAGVIIAGPAMIGEGVEVGSGSVIEGSALWAHSKLAAGVELSGCVVNRGYEVVAGKGVKNAAFGFDKAGRIRGQVRKRYARAKKMIGGAERWVSEKEMVQWVAAGMLLMAVFVWNYRAVVGDLWHIWNKSDEYSSGMLVPALFGYVVWSKRRKIMEEVRRPCWWGLALFCAGQGMRIFGVLLMYSSAERISMVVSFAGLVLFLFGAGVFKRIWSSVLFLFLMIPLPQSFHEMVTLPLQRLATDWAVFLLELCGYMVSRDGNVLRVGSAVVAVAEACNGLRMVTAFLVIVGLVVLLVERPLWEKGMLLCSSLPLALFCNAGRLTLTAITFTVVEGPQWEKFFHDFGGYLMMPAAIGVVMWELWIFGRLKNVEQGEVKTMIIERLDVNRMQGQVKS